MLQVILWALATGGITGGVWTAIVLFGRQRRLAAEHRELVLDRQRLLDELEAISARLTDVEDRVDFTERQLRSEADPARLPPPAGS